jgi:hypothetical protein
MTDAPDTRWARTVDVACIAYLVAGSGLAFQDRGENTLQGVPQRWRLYAVAPASH